MKLKPKELTPGIVAPARELETVASVPSEFPPWYPSCDDCEHVVFPPGALVMSATAMWSVGLCGKWRDGDGRPVRGIWLERYGLAASFNNITGQPEGPVKIGRCGPRAEYFEKRK